MRRRSVSSPRDGHGSEDDSMRLSVDWWAVLVAALAVILIRTGIIAGIPW